MRRIMARAVIEVQDHQICAAENKLMASTRAVRGLKRSSEGEVVESEDT